MLFRSPTEELDPLNSITHFKLRDTQITAFPNLTALADTLRYLSFYNNHQFSYIDPALLGALTILRSLVINDSPLLTFFPDVADPSGSLEWLHLENLPALQFSPIPKLGANLTVYHSFFAYCQNLYHISSENRTYIHGMCYYLLFSTITVTVTVTVYY